MYNLNKYTCILSDSGKNLEHGASTLGTSSKAIELGMSQIVRLMNLRNWLCCA